MASNLLAPVKSILGRARFHVRYPGSAVELGDGEVVAVLTRPEKGGRRLVGYGFGSFESASAGGGAGTGHGAASGHGTAVGHTVPSAAADTAIKEALGKAVRMAGLKPGKASLIVPDTVARIWVLQLSEIPRGHLAMLEMLRWKVRRSLPYRVEDGVMTWQVLARPTSNQPGIVLAGLIPRPWVTHHEALFASAGLKAGLVDLSSFNLAALVRHAFLKAGRTIEGDYAVLNVTRAWFTLMIFRKGDLIFYRCKAHAASEESAAEERVRTLRREFAASLSYYAEKLKGQRIEATLVRAADPEAGDCRDICEEVGLGGAEAIDAAAAAKLPEGLSPQAATALMPALGATLGRRG